MSKEQKDAWRKGADWMQDNVIQLSKELEAGRVSLQTMSWIKRLVGEVRTFKHNPYYAAGDRIVWKYAAGRNEPIQKGFVLGTRPPTGMLPERVQVETPSGVEWMPVTWIIGYD